MDGEKGAHMCCLPGTGGCVGLCAPKEGSTLSYSRRRPWKRACVLQASCGSAHNLLSKHSQCEPRSPRHKPKQRRAARSPRLER